MKRLTKPSLKLLTLIGCLSGVSKNTHIPKTNLFLPINGSKPPDAATNSASCGGKLQTALRLYSLQSPAPRDKSSLILLLAVSRLVVRFLFPYWQRSLLWPSVLALAVITTWLSWRCTMLARNPQSRSPYLPKKPVPPWQNLYWVY